MSSILSDFNATGPFKSSIVARKEQFTDMDIRLRNNPWNNDVSVIKDIEAVKFSVRNLIMTNFYERPFQPFIGGNISALLFENAGPITEYIIRKEIERVIFEYEPRVNRVIVSVQDKSDVNAYYVTISFNITYLQSQAEVNFFLNRLR